MAFKQPRVPEYRESEGTGKYLRSLVLFLKDFCTDVWTANNQRSGEISDAVKGYPVTSVCGKTGDVTLTAGDVGALEQNGTAVNASKLGGKTMAQLLLTVYPVGSIYLSVNNTSPASLFGGTWEQLKDRFLLGAGSAYAAGSTGGEAAHTLTESELPVLSGYVLMHGAGTGGTVVNSATGVFSSGGTESGYQSAEIKTGASSLSSINFNAGEGGPHNNMPPYLAVYMWKRVS